MAKREIFTGARSPVHGSESSRDTFLVPTNLIGLASPETVNTLSPIRSSSILTSPFVLFIRVPDKKQLQRVHGEGNGNGDGNGDGDGNGNGNGNGDSVAARADELRPAKPNPNVTAAPTNNFEAAKKLRRDVVTVAFPLAEASKEFLSMPI